MCAGLIADQPLLRNGLLIVLGVALGDVGTFVTSFVVGIAAHFGAYAKWWSFFSVLSVGLLMDAFRHATLSFS